MLLMIESGIRGGIATILHRHAKANNEYMGTEFDPTEETKLPFTCRRESFTLINQSILV